MRNVSEGELMKLLADGNRSAFQELYARYGKIVFGYSIRILKNRATAEDITQEVWIKTVRLAASFRGEGSVKGWLLKITRNTALNHFRSLKTSVAYEESQIEDNGQPEDSENNLLRILEINELKERIQELPEAQRVALVLWISERLSYEEIATEMGLSEVAVKSLIFRARRSLEQGGRP